MVEAVVIALRVMGQKVGPVHWFVMPGSGEYARARTQREGNVRGTSGHAGRSAARRYGAGGNVQRCAGCN